ncbi:MAG TPA: S1/P1 nuclease [Candidatus Saccharimonadales bacterium]|nr:S1/P1 nuclease [Candidatus Saccharimonadales bacterium]
MRTILIALLAFLGSCSLSPRVLAWGPSGHMLVAAIAYQQLTDADRAAVEKMLEGHTNYLGWLHSFNTHSPGVPQSAWVFMQAAVWPDVIRDYEVPATRANQHFVDFPLRPPKYSTNMAQPNPNDNVISGIHACEGIVSHGHSNPRKMAESVSFLIHFIGDIHQPLHCSTLFNESFPPPVGDRGGTLFYFKTNEMDPGNTLHGLWDRLLNKETQAKPILQEANELIAAFPRSQFGPGVIDKTVLQWAKESRDLSREYGYKPLPRLDAKQHHAVMLPPQYIANATEIARKRAALAGYRLAEHLRDLLAAHGEPP